MLLEEFLRPSGLTQVEAARRMGIPLNRLNEIVRGKRGITADTALRLARLFATSPEFLMSLQVDTILLVTPRRGFRRRADRARRPAIVAAFLVRAGVAESADARDSKSRGPNRP